MGRFIKDIFRSLVPSSRERHSRRLYQFWPAILLAMVVLLTIIAALQYRWTTEVTDAKEFRVGREVESRMIQWHLDLYGEFSAICIALQVGPDSGAHDSWSDYLQRYSKWSRGDQNKNSPINLYRNPDLVENVYVWETSRKVPRLWRLNAQTGTIDPASVRPDLTRALDRLQQHSANLAVALRAWQSADQVHDTNEVSGATLLRSSAITGWQFDESVPLIAHPEVRNSDGDPVDWIVIQFDRETIRARVLPSLVRRYFGGPDGLDFNVAVVATGNPSRVIYSSVAGFGDLDADAYDSVMNLFGPPPESLEGQFWQTIKNSEALESEQWRSFSAPVWFPTIEYGAADKSWMLVVQSRHGPLQGVVGRVRRQNLAISALVLLLLAFNMGIAAVAGFRAQRFADLQMNFVASISHELRTPLSVLHAAAENIKDGVVLKQGNLERYGSLMMSQTRQLMSHVDRILLYASIRSGKTQYNMRVLDVPEIVQRVVVATAELMKENKCTLVQNLEPELPCVWGDMYALCSCVENLVTNAVKYSGKDRNVFISAAHYRTAHGRYEVSISVKDRGVGIEHSELANIFEPFYRSAGAKAAQIHGTGLGLFVAKHVAEAMGGRLLVTSEVGVGSVFTLQLQARLPGTMNSQPLDHQRQEVL
jgi:signal transduction histidine kinase